MSVVGVLRSPFDVRLRSVFMRLPSAPPLALLQLTRLRRLPTELKVQGVHVPVRSVCALRRKMGGDEIVSVVDEHNNVVDNLPRWRVRGENLRHRATFIFVRNPTTGALVVQKRTPIKDYCPSHFDVCTGGVLQKGEEYGPSAARELEEELGLRTDTLKHVFDFLFEDDVTKVWGGAFVCDFEGPLSALALQESEVAAVEWMTPCEIRKRHAAGEKFTPDSMRCLDVAIQKGVIDGSR